MIKHKKNQINLKKLAKLKVIQVVYPTENMKISYLEKSESSLYSAKILFENNQFEDSITLCYFSMYNSVLALLFKYGIKSENHNASIFIIKKFFEIDTSLIEKAKEKRKRKQYYPNPKTDKEEAKEAISSAEEFNANILDFIEKTNNKNIQNIRQKIKDL